MVTHKRFRSIISLALIFCLLRLNPLFAGQASGLPDYQPAVRVGTILSGEILETSGISASKQHPGIFWVINDGGNRPALFAITASGRTMAECRLDTVRNVDWEDLAAYETREGRFLVIADVGDNRAKRKSCFLYGVREPDLKRGEPRTRCETAIEWQIEFEYPDGPQDCEAVAVDLPKNRVLLLSKRKKIPMLYALPLNTTAGKRLTAKGIARVITIPAPTAEDLEERYGRYRSQPTSMDLSEDGRTLVILTYKHAYQYHRGPGRTWAEVLCQPPGLILLPPTDTAGLLQREAICIMPDSRGLMVTSEKRFAGIYTLLPKEREDE